MADDPTLPTRDHFLANHIDIIQACSICHDGFDKQDHMPARLCGAGSCRHVFGASCLRRWLESEMPGANKCPMCRRELFQSENGEYESDSYDEEEDETMGQVQNDSAMEQSNAYEPLAIIRSERADGFDELLLSDRRRYRRNRSPPLLDDSDEEDSTQRSDTSAIDVGVIGLLDDDDGAAPTEQIHNTLVDLAASFSDHDDEGEEDDHMDDPETEDDEEEGEDDVMDHSDEDEDEQDGLLPEREPIFCIGHQEELKYGEDEVSNLWHWPDHHAIVTRLWRNLFTVCDQERIFEDDVEIQVHRAVRHTKLANGHADYDLTVIWSHQWPKVLQVARDMIREHFENRKFIELNKDKTNQWMKQMGQALDWDPCGEVGGRCGLIMSELPCPGSFPDGW